MVTVWGCKGWCKGVEKEVEGVKHPRASQGYKSHWVAHLEGLPPRLSKTTSDQQLVLPDTITLELSFRALIVTNYYGN